MSARLAALLLLTALGACGPRRAPLVMDPGADEAAIRAELDRYRARFSRNTRAMDACEGLSEERCEANPGCVFEWADDGLSLKPWCHPDEEVIHAWREERQRRLCDRSRDGVWRVYRTGTWVQGHCICPRLEVEDFVERGALFFDEDVRACRSELERCEERGGRLLRPRRVDVPRSAAIAALTPADNAHDCLRGSYPIDLTTGERVYPEWREAEQRCVLHVLEGTIVPYVQRHPHEPSSGSPSVETHLCRTP